MCNVGNPVKELEVEITSTDLVEASICGYAKQGFVFMSEGNRKIQKWKMPANVERWLLLFAMFACTPLSNSWQASGMIIDQLLESHGDLLTTYEFSSVFDWQHQQSGWYLHDEVKITIYGHFGRFYLYNWELLRSSHRWQGHYIKCYAPCW